MFKTITENPVKPAGKYVGEKSIQGKATYYNTGTDNQMIGA